MLRLMLCQVRRPTRVPAPRCQPELLHSFQSVQGGLPQQLSSLGLAVARDRSARRPSCPQGHCPRHALLFAPAMQQAGKHRSDGERKRRTRNDCGRQDGDESLVPRSRQLRDGSRARRFSTHGARTAGGAGNRPRLRADLRRRDPRPQSQSRPSPVHHRPQQAGSCRRHRFAAVHRAAYVEARAGRPHLHHLREQCRGGGDRPLHP